MALTTDQIMMLAQLGGQIGSTMGQAYDNPFAVGAGNFAQDMVAARNFMQLLQQPPTAPKKEAPKEKPEAEKSALTIQNPFDPNYRPLQLPEKPGLPSVGGGGASYGYRLPSPDELDIRDRIFTPGTAWKIDEDNNATETRKYPAQSNAGVKAAGGGGGGGVNPFRWPS